MSARTAFPSAGSKRLRPRRSAFGVGAWIRTRASAGRRPAGGASDRNSGIWDRANASQKSANGCSTFELDLAEGK